MRAFAVKIMKMPGSEIIAGNEQVRTRGGDGGGERFKRREAVVEKGAFHCVGFGNRVCRGA
jgi:hypothetical protein